ncbi:hypothetical protein BWQ96_08782 [Gracilariopsis chorda]|uniref:Uncharacterized protein n=1 Tax=Gracilariopsis chorda TaxID=448386 RepID=A0A2V3IK46_9FLOR|nr:hypothetical protein BWQ96_08782 [Gracilariopsis chorda]|eukprot:PXF41500.1 hypothetical protein BWQ96_08782 [Gracilariopsis chorda]
MSWDLFLNSKWRTESRAVSGGKVIGVGRCATREQDIEEFWWKGNGGTESRKLRAQPQKGINQRKIGV